MSVAIIIAAMNAEAWIGRAVASALLQPEATQVIMVDDASTDATAQAAQDADDGSCRLTVIRLDKNMGPAGARNRGLSMVTADWFTILDADDYIDEGRLGRMLEAAGDSCDFVADDLWLAEDSAPYGPRDMMWFKDETPAREELTLSMLVQGAIPVKGRRRRELGFLKPIIRMRKMRELNLLYDEDMRLGEDYDLYIRLLAGGAPAILTEPMGYVAVRRADSLSGRHGHEELYYFYRCTKDLESLPGLSPEEKKLLRQSRKANSKRYRWATLINAVKTRNAGQALGCFATSPDVIAHLIGKLAETTAERLTGRHQKGNV